MATGVKPRDDDSQLTRSDLEVLQEAMKSQNFRDMLSEYCEEIRDPANQAIYQQEMTQLEKERGYDVTFINPKGGYVIKTSVAGDRKAFINICSNDNIAKPTCRAEEVDGRKGLSWQLPYSIIPPREDYNNKKERCIIYDVVFHPDTLRMANANKRFRELVNKTAFEGLHKTYDIDLDNNNVRFPKSYYKGMAVPAVIRKEDPNFKPPEDVENEEMDPELMEKLFPQHTYDNNTQQQSSQENISKKSQEKKAKVNKSKNIEFSHTSINGYTIPKYIMKQQKNVDMQEFTYNKNCKQHTAIPSHLVVEINLPLLSSTKDCNLDVSDKQLILTSEKPAKYKLNIKLPYSVNDELGNAKFDTLKHLLIITLPVIKTNLELHNESTPKHDSGVESEELSGSHSEEESKDNLIEEVSSSTSTELPTSTAVDNSSVTAEEFLLSSIGYTLPSYTFNMLDDIVAFTFHVKNSNPDSVTVNNNGNVVQIKFSSIGSGFVPVYYAANIEFAKHVKFVNASGEAWDNNVILQLEVTDNVPTEFEIGLSSDDMKKEFLDISQIKTNRKNSNDANIVQQEETAMPLVEVTNLGKETNILVSSGNQKDYEEEECQEATEKDTDIILTGTTHSVNNAKSILRKPIDMKRSFSESSYEVASSMDYISSDYIPEESSLKKTVRFNDVIAKQFYRFNSSIEGQKRKNQRRKSKKRSQERQKSESEAEEDYSYITQSQKTRLKSVLKQRRDSGLADTSDAEVDNKSTVSDSEVMYNYDNDTDENSNNNKQSSKNPSNNEDLDNNFSIAKEKPTNDSKAEKDTNIKHNTNLYNPDKLNKGQYLEVKFKNDLIFDLDM